jgi:hypothetical protein
VEENSFGAVESLVCGLLKDVHRRKEGLGILKGGGGEQDFGVVRILRCGDADGRGVGWRDGVVVGVVTWDGDAKASVLEPTHEGLGDEEVE